MAPRSHHCSTCRKSAKASCVRKGNIKFCVPHGRFYQNWSKCSVCVKMAKLDKEQTKQKAWIQVGFVSREAQTRNVPVDTNVESRWGSTAYATIETRYAEQTDDTLGLSTSGSLAFLVRSEALKDIFVCLWNSQRWGHSLCNNLPPEMFWTSYDAHRCVVQ
jgi:hypothetical protein